MIQITKLGAIMRATSILLTTAILIFFSSNLLAQNDTEPGQNLPDQQRRVENNGKKKANASRADRRRRRANVNPATIFSRLDKNSDGVLAADEVPERMHRQLDQIDADGSETVSKQEWMAAIKKRMKEARNRAGNRSADGQPGQMKKDGRKGRQLDPTAIINRIDSNGDGQLSIEEAPQRMKEKFARIDANGDSFVDEKELRAVFEQMKSKKEGRYDTDPDAAKGQVPKRPPGRTP